MKESLICVALSPRANFLSTSEILKISGRVEPYGHSIYWGEDGDEEFDFGCDRLREMAGEQTALLALAG